MCMHGTRHIALPHSFDISALKEASSVGFGGETVASNFKENYRKMRDSKGYTSTIVSSVPPPTVQQVRYLVCDGTMPSSVANSHQRNSDVWPCGTISVTVRRLFCDRRVLVL